MLNPGSPRVRLTRYQNRRHLSLWGFKQKVTVGLRYHDIVVAMSVPASFGTRRKSPFSYDDMFV